MSKNTILEGWYFLAEVDSAKVGLTFELKHDVLDLGERPTKFLIKAEAAKVEPSFGKIKSFVGEYISEIVQEGPTLYFLEEYGEVLFTVTGEITAQHVPYNASDLLKVVNAKNREIEERYKIERELRARIMETESFLSRSITRTMQVLDQNPSDKARFEERLRFLKSVMNVLRGK